MTNKQPVPSSGEDNGPADNTTHPGPNARYAAAIGLLSRYLDRSAEALLDAFAASADLAPGPPDRPSLLGYLGTDLADLRDMLARLVGEEIEAMPRAA